MWRVALVLGAIAIATPGTAASQSPAATADGILKLTAAADEAGWISLAISGPDGGSVAVDELAGERSLPVARLGLGAGTAELRHATPWRCQRQSRRFVATLTDAAGGAQSATATVTTPSCAGRLRMTVVPGEVRPGQSASVRVSDAWRLGEISAKLCARTGEGEPACQVVQLPSETVTRSARLRLPSRGRATIELRSAFGQRLTAGVDVRSDARLRVLVTGDSMIFGLAETLGGDLGRRALVTGDGHPGRGITTPGPFDWPSHARRSARSLRPDVTVVVLGAADAGYPLTTPDGTAVQCCEPPWIAVYSLSVRSMMDAYLRDGRGLVYWVILPAPRSPQKAKVMRAENEAARGAGRGDDDGVRVVDRIAEVLAPHDSFQEAIRYQGRQRVVRDSDGLHLAPPGIRIATNILKDLLRRDGLLR